MAHVNKGYQFDGDVAEQGSSPDLKTSTNAALLNKDHRISKLSTIIKFLVFLLLAAVVAVVIIAVLYVEKDDDADDDKDLSKSINKQPQVCTTTDCLTSVFGVFNLPTKSDYNTVACGRPHFLSVSIELFKMSDRSISHAAQIYFKMNMSADPCEDFYEYACGRYMSEKEIPEDSSRLDVFMEVDDVVTEKIHAILEAERKDEDPDYLNKAKDLYISCMDTYTVEQRGYEPLKELIEEEYGSVPVLDPAWNESDFDLISQLQKTFINGQAPLFWIWVGPDIKRDSKSIIKIDQPSLGLTNREYYMNGRNSSTLTWYEGQIADLTILMGANETTAKEDAVAIVDLEYELAQISAPISERQDGYKIYNPITLEDIHKDYEGVFDWKKFVKGLMEHYGVNPPITDTERMLSYSPKFFSSFKNVLENTPKRVLANFVIINVAFNFESWLSKPFRQLHLKYEKLLYGKMVASPREKSCMNVVSNVIGLAVGQVYIKENFDQEAKKEVLTMIKNLKAAFDELLDELDWMDEETKVLAREKNKHIVSSVGYPEVILNNTYLEEKYANFHFVTDDLFNNIHLARKEFKRVEFVSLRKDIDPREWHEPPHVVNAYYNTIQNKIMFPAGILNPPFFGFTYPKSMMYGAIGVVIGHEITHGFDDNGSQFNKDGIMTKWWNDEVVEKFKTQKQCIIDQYSNFTATQINRTLNGIITQGENIADNGGVRQSFRAYRNWVASQGKEEPLLPGLDLDHNKLFFVSFGQVWCQKWTDKALLNKILNGPHSPGEFRVLGPIQNSDGFAESFNCKPGSPMSRKDKCLVW